MAVWVCSVSDKQPQALGSSLGHLKDAQEEHLRTNGSVSWTWQSGPLGLADNASWASAEQPGCAVQERLRGPGKCDQKQWRAAGVPIGAPSVQEG